MEPKSMLFKLALTINVKTISFVKNLHNIFLWKTPSILKKNMVLENKVNFVT